MSQKINPVSIRIGNKNPWHIVCQNYGKSSLIFSKYIFKIFFLFSFFQLISTSDILLNSRFFVLSDQNYLILKTFSLEDASPNKLVKFQKQFSSVLSWTPKLSNFRFFFAYEFLMSTLALSFYFKFLVTHKFSFKKAMSILTTLISSKLDHSKIIDSKFGIKKLKLKGFKIYLSGRFDNSKNQMSKKYEQTVGSLPLLSLSSHIEFSTCNIYTKLGVCNFKIWLFYN